MQIDRMTLKLIRIIRKIFRIFIAASFDLGYDQSPPEIWQENWFEHNQTLKRHYYDDDVAIYFDKDVNRSITWMNSYLREVWIYTKRVYGKFGDDPHLYAIFHTGKYSGGHPVTYFDALKSYRNVIDCGKLEGNAWSSGQGNDLDLTTHEVAHIVEGASNGVHNSPAFRIWGDSKWAEIFTYDVYLALNRKSDAQRWRQMQMSTRDSFPRENTYWFRDWFLPIYERHGGSSVLNSFFQLLAQYFPKSNGGSFGRPQYTRDMNHGEFFHFWSGAAGKDLKGLATKAFGWNDQYEKKFQQARRDFPEINYQRIFSNDD